MDENLILRQIGIDPMYNIWHKNEDNYFLYIYSGDGSIVFNNKIYSIKPGVLCYIPNKTQHYTSPETPSSYERSKLGISDENISKITSGSVQTLALTSSVVYAQIPPHEQGNIEIIWSVIENSKLTGKAKQNLVNGCALQLLAYLNTYKVDSTKLLDHSIECALEYINTNISSTLDIDTISDAVHLSKYYFCHLFKKTMGTGVMKYVWITRLSLAKEMLADNKYSISEIASLCGFESPSNFCHSFKKQFGMTASQYKKSITSL